MGLFSFLFGGKKKEEDTKPKESSILGSDDNVGESEKKDVAKLEKKYKSEIQKVNDKCKNLENQIQTLKSEKEKVEKQLSEALSKVKDSSRSASKSDNAENSKLKKQIEDLQKEKKSLEEDLEDAEDDLEAEKKKRKKKEDELDKLQTKMKEECDKLKKELDSTKQSLEEAEETIASKGEALSFVQKILSAQEFGNSDYNALHEKINKCYDFMYGMYSDLNIFLYKENGWKYGGVSGQEAVNNKMNYFLPLADQWAAVKSKDWLDGKITIAFIGEFSAGKTSIVNRILSQDDPKIPLLPVSTKATTAIPTYISGGLATSYTFISGDEERKSISEETFKMVSKEVLDQVPGVSSLIKYFVMTYKNPNLNGLSILDTPGFNSNDEEDKERTIEVINECDALFWVMDVNAGTVNKSSLNIIKEKLNKPLYVVINKVDDKAPSEVDKVENLIKKTLQNEGISVNQFIRFSKKAPLSDIMNAVKGVSGDASRDSFVQALRDDLSDLVKLSDNQVSLAQKNLSDSKANQRGIVENFVGCLNSVSNSCIYASRIPHYETHWEIFGGNRYEMSSSECSKLLNYLKSACVQTKNMEELFDQVQDVAQKVQNNYEWLCKQQLIHERMLVCQKEFENVFKNFN